MEKDLFTAERKKFISQCSSSCLAPIYYLQKRKGKKRKQLGSESSCTNTEYYKHHILAKTKFILLVISKNILMNIVICNT
jgi:hypothetical protein